MCFWYGPDRQRFRQVANFTSGSETTHYVGGVLEKLVTASNTQYRHFIAGPSGLVAIYTRRVSGNPLEDTFYFTHDHQGNVDSITRADGSVQVRLSYDAFGKRRQEAGWSGPVPGSDWTAIAASSRRGYTEHEHLDNLGLIHMNGRVQDPLIGRFLSADPYVPDPWDGQSFNRYSYVRNNPLSRVDPTGFTDDFGTRCQEPCFGPIGSGGFSGGRGIAPNLYGTGALTFTASVLAAYMDAPGQGPALSASASTEVDQHNQQTVKVNLAASDAESRSWMNLFGILGKSRTEIIYRRDEYARKEPGDMRAVEEAVKAAIRILAPNRRIPGVNQLWVRIVPPHNNTDQDYVPGRASGGNSHVDVSTDEISILNQTELNSVLLHEIKHSVQAGARGRNPRRGAEYRNDQREALQLQWDLRNHPDFRLERNREFTERIRQACIEYGGNCSYDD